MITIGCEGSVSGSSVRVLEAVLSCACSELPIDGEGTVGIPHVRLPYYGSVFSEVDRGGSLSEGWNLSVIDFSILDYLDRDNVVRVVAPYVVKEGRKIVLKLSYGGDRNTRGREHLVAGRVDYLTAVENFIGEYFGSIYDLEVEDFDVWRVSDLGGVGGLQVHRGDLGYVFSADWGYNSGRVFDVFISAEWDQVKDISLLKKISKNDFICKKYGDDFRSFRGSFCTPFWVAKQLDLDLQKYEEMRK